MRISLFSAFYPFRGGIAHFNERLVRELDLKNEVSIFTFKKQYPDFLFPGSSQFVSSEKPEWVGRAKRVVSTFNPLTYFSAARKIKASNPNVFIVNYWMSFFAPFLSLFARFLGDKSVKIALIHNLVPHERRFFDYALNKMFVRQYDGFVVMSDEVKNDLLKIDPQAKVLKLSHPWYDHFSEKMDRVDACNLLGVDPKQKIILFFGLIREYKGLDLLLQAFSQLNDSYTLIVAGEFYGSRDQYRRYLMNEDLSKRIVVHDYFIPDEKVNIYFSAADLCVLPYRSATQSGVTSTAFHFDVPVIVTDVGGLSESVGKMGKVVPSNDVDALSKSICEFFDFNQGLQFKELIAKHRNENSWENFADKTIEFCSRLKTI